MKKILAVVLIIVMCFSLCACGGKKKAEKFCSDCGEAISKKVAFCEHCGAAIKDNEKGGYEDNSSNNKTLEAQTSNPSEESKVNDTSVPTSTKIEESTPSNTSKPTIPAHTHSYSKKVTASTCTQKGYTTYTCSCGNTYKDNYTNPSHKYSNYKCTNCGQMDKENLFSFLKAYVLKKGKTNGEYVHFSYITDYLSDGLTRSIMLTYCVSDDKLYFSNFEEITDDFAFITYIYIPKNTTMTYEFSGNLYNTVKGETPYYCEGKIAAKGFTKNTPISCSYYSGNVVDRPTITESTRLGLVYLIECIDIFHTEYETGYALADMGFDSFKY